MLSKDQVLKTVTSGKGSSCIDGRDYSRLVNFFPVSDWALFGFKFTGQGDPPDPRPWTEQEVIHQLREDVEFGFRKALNQRGISSGLMYDVVKMWLWVLEDELQHFDEYAMYGLPLFKSVAVKYGFDNPIGDDVGNEGKYAEYG